MRSHRNRRTDISTQDIIIRSASKIHTPVYVTGTRILTKSAEIPLSPKPRSTDRITSTDNPCISRNEYTRTSTPSDTNYLSQKNLIFEIRKSTPTTFSDLITDLRLERQLEVTAFSFAV